jgi:autotransporter-associated beta strand protein
MRMFRRIAIKRIVDCRFAIAMLSGLVWYSASGGETMAQRALGIDVSAYQGNLSTTTWATFKRPTDQQVSGVFGDGRDFVFIRSSRGGTTGEDHRQGGYPAGNNTFYNLSQRYDDPYFVQNVNRATAAGMFAGSYHFDRADILATTLNSDGVTTAGVANDGADEANHFMQMAGAWMRPGYMLPVLDLEAGSNRTQTELSNYSIAFSDRIYAVMGIRPMVYANSSYVNDEVNSSVATSMPNLWIARPTSGDPLTTEPPPHPAYPNVYGKWNPLYPNTPDPAPWKFWQYNTSNALNGYSGPIDKDAAHGDLEYVKDFLVPALWIANSSGDWSTLASWNSGQTPTAPPAIAGQLTPIGTQTLPTARLPGAAGSGVTSGQYDTVILDNTGANITVTLSSGSFNIRKLYMRETLDLTGGSLTINYDPLYNFNTATANAVRSGPISAQFSGAVSLSGNAALTVPVLQVDASKTFTLAGGTLTFNKINLLSSAKILVSGDVTLNPWSTSNPRYTSLTASISGASAIVDLGGGTRTFTIGNLADDVDLDVAVPIINGGLTKNGAGTMRLSGANTFTGAVTVNAGVLRSNNAAGFSSSSAITVNGGTLDMNGITDTVASLAGSGGAITQGAAGLTLAATSGSTAFAGTITGTATLTKNGGSTQILSGNNSLGPVALSAGALLFNGSNTTGAVTVSGGTLGGTGSVSGAVTVNTTGHLAPGASIESLDVGALTLNAGSVLDAELGAPGTGDRVNVTGLLTLNGGTINLINSGGLDAGTYTLFQYGSLTGSVASLGIPTGGPSNFTYALLDTGSAINLSVGIPGDFNHDASVDAADYVAWLKNDGTPAGYDLWRSNFGRAAGSGAGAGLGDLASVPEPTTILMAACGLLPFIAQRRSRDRRSACSL